VLLLGALLSGCRSDQGPGVSAADGAAKAGVKRFWQAYGEATRLRIAGKTADAVNRYYDALKDDPSHEDSRYYLASSLASLGDYRRAVEVYGELVRRNPFSHRGHFQLGLSLSTPEPGAALDLELARRSFERNLEINREESGPFLRLGDLALFEGNLEEARKQYDVAAGFQSPEGMFRAGFARYAAGEYREAAALFREVLAQNERERKISGRGVHSEGDIRSSSGAMTPLERAGIQSLVYLYWTSRKLGGYPGAVPAESRLEPRSASGLSFEPWKLEAGRVTEVSSVRDLWDEEWQPIPSAEQARRAAVPRNLPAFGPAGHGRTVVDAGSADFDSNGARDVVLLTWKAGLTIYCATDDGKFEDRTVESGLPAEGIESFALAVLDFDQDQRPDILLAPYAPYPDVLRNLAQPASSSPSCLQLYRNIGGAKFRRVYLPGAAEAHGVIRAVSADFDSDGFPDLLLACGGLDGIRLEPSLVLRNERGKSFHVAAWLPGFDNPARALGAAAADYDGDGRVDVCLKTARGLQYLRNTR
jgi:tetratricopeptide (TPR) repeat protein